MRPIGARPTTCPAAGRPGATAPAARRGGAPGVARARPAVGGPPRDELETASPRAGGAVDGRPLATVEARTELRAALAATRWGPEPRTTGARGSGLGALLGPPPGAMPRAPGQTAAALRRCARRAGGSGGPGDGLARAAAALPGGTPLTAALERERRLGEVLARLDALRARVTAAMVAVSTG